MQWNSGKNLGFSDADECYLPVDTSADAPTVENQKDDPESIYKVVKDVIALRHSNKDLGNDGDFKVVYAEKDKYPFVYKRGGFVIVVNPSNKDVKVPFDFDVKETVYQIGKTQVEDKTVTAFASSFAIFKV